VYGRIRKRERNDDALSTATVMLPASSNGPSGSAAFLIGKYFFSNFSAAVRRIV